jgi:hypothetical protein
VVLNDPNPVCGEGVADSRCWLGRQRPIKSKPQHYAMAAYYVRVAEAKEKLAKTAEIMMSNDASNRR